MLAKTYASVLAFLEAVRTTRSGVTNRMPVNARSSEMTTQTARRPVLKISLIFSYVDGGSSKIGFHPQFFGSVNFRQSSS